MAQRGWGRHAAATPWATGLPIAAFFAVLAALADVAFVRAIGVAVGGWWIPANLAYGDSPRPGAPKGQLTFDVELLEITKPPTPPEVPKDVAAAPASAKKTASGLRYSVLKPGTGKDHPTPQNRVKVNYSGWTTRAISPA